MGMEERLKDGQGRMSNLWPNNCFIVLVLLNEADKENSSLNVPFCEFAAGTASKTHSPCS